MPTSTTFIVETAQSSHYNLHFQFVIYKFICNEEIVIQDLT